MSIFPIRILLATDGSEEAALAAHSALEIANSTGSELHVVHVGAPLPIPRHYEGLYMGEYIEEEEKELERRGQGLLDEQLERIKATGGSVAQAHLRIGIPDEEIVALAEELGAGLIVVGSRGRGGLRRALMGSVSDSVVRHAHCPVLVVRKENSEEEMVSVFPTRILLATDGSEEAELALEMAVELVNSTHSKLHVLSVGVPDLPDYVDLLEEAYRRFERHGQQTLDEQVKKVEKAGGIVAKAHFTMEGRPSQEIVRLSEEIGAGLVVMGSRGLGGVRRALMGSVSDKVVRHAHCPVLVARKEKR